MSKITELIEHSEYDPKKKQILLDFERRLRILEKRKKPGRPKKGQADA